MYKKTFVSINFTSTKLQFLQLDNSKNTLLRLGEISLPTGIIENYKVADVAGLTAILISAWKQFGFKEKSVGIVVPEFSTFTKTLMLPHLEGHELDEAVRWQAQEFLPDAGRQMVLDWKIINSTETEYQILLVAIHQDSLSGFIKAAADAGLYPLVVETPSLSLVRIATQSTESRLIIYANLGEAILISAHGEKIIGSVVVRSADQKEILTAAINLVRRYWDNRPQKVYIGGLQISKALSDSLKAQLKIEPLWLSQKIAKIDATQMQQYLVPLSLQLKDPTEPSDENTINLLPPTWVDVYTTKKRKVEIWGLLSLSTIVLWTCLFALIGVYFAMQTQLSSSSSEIKGEIATTGEVQKDIIKINTLSGRVTKITESYPEPAVIINPITSVLNPSINLQKYIIDFEQGYIKLSGVAQNRKALLDFKSKLEENKDFSEINLPLSALIAQQDISFNLEFTYIPLVPKKNNAKLK